MIGLAIHGLATWTLYATWANNHHWVWWSLLAVWSAMILSGTATLNAERFAKEKYAEDTGLPLDLVMQRQMPLSQFGDYRRPAMIAWGFNITFTLLTVALSVAGLILD